MPPGPTVAERAAIDAASRDLCRRDVVLLGENDFHGDGRTIAFKAALVRNLIQRCRFQAVFFEASHYDFLDFARRLRTGQDVSPEMLSSAIGRIWNRDSEIAPLIPFLFAQAKAGRVTLGGLDDQVGSRDAYYSNDLMPAELAAMLPAARREPCRQLLVQRIHGGSVPDPEALRLCLAEIGGIVSARPGSAERDDLLEMVANFVRDVARDGDSAVQRVQGRDHSMYLNLRWLAARLKPNARIIVWAENAHVAKDVAASADFGGGRNLGAFVHEAYGRRSFVLGFSAASGSFRWSAHTAHPIPAAAPGSLEAQAIAGGAGDPAYLGPRRLRRLGRVSGGLFDHRDAVADWSAIVDGLIVFRTERPPLRTDE